MINVIFATTCNDVFASENGTDLAWGRIKEEMNYFRKVTLNNAVVMGKDTFLSMNSKPLKNRLNIVVSTTMETNTDDSYFVSRNLNESIDIAREKSTSDIFIIGGRKLIQEAIDSNIVDNIYHTCIEGEKAMKITGIKHIFNFSSYVLTDLTLVKTEDYHLLFKIFTKTEKEIKVI